MRYKMAVAQALLLSARVRVRGKAKVITSRTSGKVQREWRVYLITRGTSACLEEGIGKWITKRKQEKEKQGRGGGAAEASFKCGVNAY
jgi:hypothetical protein